MRSSRQRTLEFTIFTTLFGEVRSQVENTPFKLHCHLLPVYSIYLSPLQLTIGLLEIQPDREMTFQPTEVAESDCT